MKMDFTKATYAQLLTILSEVDCPAPYKYKALFELQSRKEKVISRKVSKLKNRAAYTDKAYRI